MKNKQDHFEILRKLQKNPNSSQRVLAKELGFSLGKLNYCLKKGIEAKIHYPIPLYQQPALAHLEYRKGDFPVTDRHANECISFPVDQHISDVEQDYVIETVRSFYRDNNYG